MTSDRSRLVIDTNVWVSGLLVSHSVPAQLIRYAVIQCDVLMSHALLHELGMVLARDKFDPYVPPEDRRLFLQKLHKISKPVSIIQRVNACRDAGDNMILELAVNGSAHEIVSGDADLLQLLCYRGIAIINPAEFLRRRGQQPG